ncbi:MAG TPA: hypothetical protein VGD22_19450 [Sphingobacteriaceae bacterium]
MIKIVRLFFFSIILLAGINGQAQTTTSSPYSQFGLGDLKQSLLPQSRAMGGIAMGLRKPGLYTNINVANPASYSAVQITSFEIGQSLNLRQLSNKSVSENSFNSSISHIAFAMPVSPKSGLSFGLLPYSELGYNYRIPSRVDTTDIDYIYSGDGGLSKAHLGYGFQIGKHLSLGANVSYLFGKLKQSRSTEFPGDYSALYSRVENSNSVGGLSYDYGIQYFTNVSSKARLIIGYSGNAGSKINSTGSTVATHYRIDPQSGEDIGILDTIFFSERDKRSLKMPMTHSVGFVIERTNRWLVGADFNYAKWSDFTDGSVNPNLNDSYGISVGGQVTPDPTDVTNYFRLIEYRLGFKYDKTPVQIRNTDINQYALTFGFGFPLPANRSAFYQISLSAEAGQRGTQDNNLVRERYMNFHLGFTLNDRWFTKPKYD